MRRSYNNQTTKTLLGIFYSLCLILCIGQNSNAQTVNIDSLIALLPSLEADTHKVNLLNSISWEYHRSDYQKNLEYGQSAYELSDKIEFPKGKARAMNLMAIAYASLGDNEKSIELNEKVLEIAKSIKNDYLIGVASNDLGISYSDKGDFEKALELYQISLDIAESSNDKLGIAFGYSNIGNLHSQLGNIEEAKSYYNKSIVAGKQSDDPFVLIGTYQQLASLYFDDGQHELALKKYEKVINLAEDINDHYSHALSLLNIAYIYIHKDYNELAINKITEGIQIAKSAKDTPLESLLILELANIYKISDELDKAKETILVSLEFAQEHQFTDNEMYSYQVLAEIYEEEENYKQALEITKKKMILEDSLFSQEKINHATELEKKYQVQKKETENLALKAKQANQKETIKYQRRTNLALGFIICLIAFLGYYAFKQSLNRRKQNKLLEENVKVRTEELLISNSELKNSNIELERFAYITSHDLKEPLRNISSFAKLLDRSLKLEEGTKEKDFLDFIIMNTQQMHRLIEDVLEYSKLSHKKVDEEWVDLNKTISSIKNAISGLIEERNITINVIELLPILKSHPARMYLLFKNLIENGIKYNDSNYPKITIDYDKTPLKHHITISDNGIGIGQDYHDQIFEMFKRLHNREIYEGTGLGLSLSKKIVTSLEGKIWVESELGKGSTFHITFPVSTEPIPNDEVLEAIEV